MEHRLLRPDGSTGWVFSRAVPILDDNEALLTWFGTFSDITERKRIELNLIETTAVAEKANRAKSGFLSSMSHELRTPLHAILGFAQLMESGTPAPTDTQGRNLKQIIKGGWYLLSLIEELLDLAQIESGKLPLTEEPVSLSEVMLECRAMIEPLACERGIGMIFPAFEFPGHVRADRNRVKQVVINLLSNAIKYNKAQGAVTVEYALSSPGAIRISVRDTGEGLAPEQLAQLFQPFNRLGREAGPEHGTGIGLVMSKRLVALMGGTMGVDSTVGVGSVFWIELKWSNGLDQTVISGII
jgi:signal transduction histidine kinase